jgi:hypothetical protein
MPVTNPEDASIGVGGPIEVSDDRVREKLRLARLRDRNHLRLENSVNSYLGTLLECPTSMVRPLLEHTEATDPALLNKTLVATGTSAGASSAGTLHTVDDTSDLIGHDVSSAASLPLYAILNLHKSSNIATHAGATALRLPRLPIPRFSNSYLKPNAKFVGEQLSEKARYYVEVQFKTVDLVNLLITGYLQITGLTDAPASMTTCFKGEIINNPLHKYQWGAPDPSSGAESVRKYSFVTENKSWESLMKNDFDHWEILMQSRGASEQHIRTVLGDIQTHDYHSSSSQYIYMRWKEEFLVPDARIKRIENTSFDGFYYIVLNIGNGDKHGAMASRHGASIDSQTCAGTPGSISGLYYHKTTEMLQLLSLGFVNDHGTTSEFDFC